MIEYNDFPIQDVMKEANKLIAKGADVYQKFTCAGCGARLTIDNPNTFYAEGTCDQCSHVTTIEKCNFLVHMWSKPKGNTR